MKTTVYLVGVMALLSLACASAQTNPVAQLLPVYKHGTVPPVTANKVPSEQSSAKEIESLLSQIKNLEKLKEKLNSKINEFFVKEEVTKADALVVNSKNAYLTIESMEAEIDRIDKEANTYYIQAKSANEKERKELLNKARVLEENSLLMKIDKAFFVASINKEKYEDNKLEIENLIKGFSGANSRLIKIDGIMFEASRYYRIGKEMREEASAELSKVAKLGVMQNAEEQEYKALAKQEEVKEMLGVSLCTN